MRIVVDKRGVVQSNPEEATSLVVSGSIVNKPNGTIVTQVAGVIMGSYGNPSSGTPRVCTRPAASSCVTGTLFIPVDDRTHWACGVKPSDGVTHIWTPSSAPSVRTVLSIVTGTNAVASHFGNYDPVTNRFTPVTASGQSANATAGTTATVGNSLYVIPFPGAATMGIPSWTGPLAGEIMCDATGAGIPYVNNGTNVALGISLTPPGITATVSFVMYEY